MQEALECFFNLFFLEFHALALYLVAGMLKHLFIGFYVVGKIFQVIGQNHLDDSIVCFYLLFKDEISLFFIFMIFVVFSYLVRQMTYYSGYSDKGFNIFFKIILIYLPLSFI